MLCPKGARNNDTKNHLLTVLENVKILALCQKSDCFSLRFIRLIKSNRTNFQRVNKKNGMALILHIQKGGFLNKGGIMVDLKKVGGMRAPPVRDAAEKARERELIKSMVEARNTDREILRAVRIQNLSENISALKEEIARQRLEYISSPLIQGQIVALVNAGKTDEEIRFTILGASKPGDVSEGILMILGTRITLQKSGIGSETKGGMSTTPPKSQAPSAGQLGLSRFRNKPPSKG